jgi:hypothetical protein
MQLAAPDADRFAGAELTGLAIAFRVETPSRPKIVSSKASWLCGIGTLAQEVTR